MPFRPSSIAMSILNRENRADSVPTYGAGCHSFNTTYLYGLSFISAVFTVYYSHLSVLSFGHVSALFFIGYSAVYFLLHSRFGYYPTPSFRLPGKSLDQYMSLADASLQGYLANSKIPMEVFIENYIQKKIDIKGDCLTLFENRYDWATFEITCSQAMFFLFGLVPEMWHSRSQDIRQVRELYDRGNDFFAFFLGKSMVYSSGIVSDASKQESLEVLQQNKFATIAEKLRLQAGDTLLDLGCGWGTFACHAAKYFGVQATGVTLSENQHRSCLDLAQEYGVANKTTFLCQDARDIPAKKYDKIACLEMAEHVGVRNFSGFLNQIREMLEDDGLFCLQISGLRAAWQYEDLAFGLFLNKYIFPGADAFNSLSWYTANLESAGFEVRSVDTIGCHYSSTILRWYELWISNRSEILEKYGECWFRLWEVYLAWSVILFRQGSVACYQITCCKSINRFN